MTKSLVMINLNVDIDHHHPPSQVYLHIFCQPSFVNNPHVLNMTFDVQQQPLTKNGQSKPQPCVKKHWVGHNIKSMHSMKQGVAMCKKNVGMAKF